MHNTVITHVNTKNRPLVANLIMFKEPIIVNHFVTAKEDKVNYTVMTGASDEKEDTEMKKNEQEWVSYQIKFQMQEYQKALTFIQALWNMVHDQCTESFQLLLKRKTDWEDCRKNKDLF